LKNKRIEAATTHDFDRDEQGYEEWMSIDIPWLAK